MWRLEDVERAKVVQFLKKQLLSVCEDIVECGMLLQRQCSKPNYL